MPISRTAADAGPEVPMAVPAGLAAQLEITTLGAWKGFRWALPVGVALADTSRFEPLLPRLYASLPPFSIGNGATWNEVSEGFNAGLTNVTTAEIHSIARNVDPAGFDLEYTEVVSAPKQMLAAPGRTYELEAGSGTGSGRIRVSRERWIEHAVYERRMSLRLRDDGDGGAHGTTLLVALRVEARTSDAPR